MHFADLDPRREMKLVFVLPGRGNSGGVRCTSLLAKGLRDRGHDVRILYQAPNLEGSCRSIWTRLLGSQDWLREFPGQVTSFKDLSQCSFRSSEIIIGVGMAMSYQIGLLDSLPNPRVQYIHGSTPRDPILRQKTLGMSLPKIVVASYLKDLVKAIGGGDVLAVVHNGVDFSEYYRVVPEAQRDGIGTIYSSSSAKDPSTVLALISELLSSQPVPIRVFGGSRRPRELPRSIYSRYPSLERARDIYSRSLVWILASESEGFGLPVLEAMACGCVVVATDCGGPRDLIIDGETGFLVPIGDVERIVETAVMLVDDVKLCEKMRTNSLKRVKQFSWEKCVDELELALEKLVPEMLVSTGT
jgi:glycosyltransferase involved in cell wall biosynthesis